MPYQPRSRAFPAWSPRPARQARQRPAPKPRRLALAIAAAAATVVTLVIALRWGGGVSRSRLTDLPEAGPITAWGLPLARVMADLAGAVTVGFTIMAAFLLPGDGRRLTPLGYRVVRRATVAAAVWLSAVVALLVLTTSDVLGQPVTAVGAPAVVSFATSVATGQALAVQALLAACVAIGCAALASRTGAAAAAGLAALAVLPPALTGHAAGAGNHQIAVTSLAMHVLAVSLWVGGLIAVLTVPGEAVLPGVAGRYSRLAGWCFAAVAVSGAINAWVRVGSAGQLWHSRYGLLVVGKVVALVLAGALGAAHRRLALPRLAAGRPWAFARLAAGEIVVLTAAVGLAVALSRTPTPVATNPANPDPVTDLLGFGMPAAPTVGRMLADALPDLFFLVIVAVGIGAYLAGALRLHRQGHRWPVGRTASWVAGLLLLAAWTSLGVARYAYLLFSVHMAQHMVLSMLVPILLVTGAPATLALRALRRPADPGVRGPREWLTLALHSRATRLFTHPVTVLTLYVVSLYALYFSGLLAVAMRYHVGHLAMLVHFVVAGYLFFWVLIGIDPGRRQLPPPVLMAVHFAAMSFHAFFGVILLQAGTVLAAGWFGAVHPPWAGSPLADQNLGAGIAWAFGEIPAVFVFGLLLMQWIHADEREQRRVDRAAQRAEDTGTEDALARYNEFLRKANNPAEG
jgi:putative copper resistance protein D